MAYQKRTTNPFYEAILREEAQQAATPIAQSQSSGFDVGGMFSGIGSFASDLGKGFARMIPSAAASLGTIVGDMPANIESGLYSGFAAGNRLFGNENEARRLEMLRDNTTATNNPLDSAGLVSQRLFDKYGTNYTNQLYDLAKGDRAKELEKSNIGFIKPVIDLLSPEEKRTKDQGYASDAFNVATTAIPVGTLAGAGAKGAKVSSPFLRGLLELDGVAKPTIQNAGKYVAGRAGSGAIQGGAMPILQSLDKGQDVNWNDAGQQALVGGAFGGAMSSPALVRPNLLAPNTAKQNLYGGKSATGFEDAQGKFTNLTDNQQRFEIDDSKAKIKGGIETFDKALRLEDVLDHPQLYKQYPDIAKTEIAVFNDVGNGAVASFANDSMIIFKEDFIKNPQKYSTPTIIDKEGKPVQLDLSKLSNAERIKSTTLHEVQHIIQGKEGFAKGGSPRNVQETPEFQSMYNSLAEEQSKIFSIPQQQRTPEIQQRLQTVNQSLEALDTSPFEAYRRLAGEVESRDVQARMNLTPQQRMGISPLSSQNIPVKDQIVRMDGGKQASIKNIPDELQPLAQEARRYKSAEEFANSMPTVFHGTSRKFENFDDTKLGEATKANSAKAGFFFTDDVETAKSYPKAENWRKVDELIAQGKMQEAEKLEAQIFNNTAPSNIMERKLVPQNPLEIDADGANFNDFSEQMGMAIEQAKKQGNDVIIFKNLSDSGDYSDYRPATHYLVLDNKAIKTDKDLTSIYNKVNGKDNTMMSMADDFELDFGNTTKPTSNLPQPARAEATIEDLPRAAKKYADTVTTSYKQIEKLNTELDKLTNDNAKTSLSKRTSGWFDKNGSQGYTGEIYEKAQRLFAERQALNNKIKANEQLVRRNIIKADPELAGKLDEIKSLTSDPEYMKGYDDLYGEGASQEYRKELLKELNDEVDIRMPDLMPISKAEKDTIKAQIRKTEAQKQLELTGTLDDANKYAGSVNKNYLDIDNDAKKLLDDSTELIKKDIEKQKGSALTEKEAMDAAKLSEAFKKNIDKEDTTKIVGEIVKLRQNVAEMLEKGEVTKELLDNIKTLNGVASDSGRRLRLGFGTKVDGEETITIQQKILQELVKMSDDTDAILKAAQGVDLTNRKQVTKLYRQFIKPKLGEYIDQIRYANILSSPLTHITNIFSNALQVGLQGPVKLLSGGIDMIGSSLTGKERQNYAREVAPYYKGVLSSVGEASQNFVKALKGEGQISDVEELKYLSTGKAWMKPFESVTNLLQAQDVFFRTIVKNGEKEALMAKYKAKGETISDAVLDKIAEDKAKYVIFTSDTDSTNKTGQGHVLSYIDKFTNGIKQLRETAPGVSWFIPFVQTPMNILKQMIEYSPLGVTTLFGSNKKSEQLAKAFIGSTVMAGAAHLISQTDSTWSAPTGEKEKEAFYASGRQPYSIKIGDNWVSYSKLGPLAMPIAMAAAMKYQNEQSSDSVKKEGLDRWTSTAGEIASFFGDQSYLKGLGDLADALRGDKQASSSFIANLPGQMIPMSSLQAWVSRIVDPTQRKPEGILETLQSRTPFLSQGVAPMRGYTGEPVQRQAPLINAFSPIKIGIDNKEEDINYKLTQAEKFNNQIKTVQRNANNGDIPEQQAKQQVSLLETARDRMLQGTGISADQVTSTLKTNMPKAEIEKQNVFSMNNSTPNLLKTTGGFKSKKIKTPKFKKSKLKKSKIKKNPFKTKKS